MANQEQVEALKQGVEAWAAWEQEHPTQEVDLSGANLRGLSLPFVRLPLANLRGVDLSEANLSDTSFHFADLSGAKLRGTIFFQADLTSANFQESDLSESDLRRARLSDARMDGAVLRHASLHKANLWQANLAHANLERAYCEMVQFNQAILTGANLRQTQLFRARFDQASLEQADLTDASLEGADFSEALVTDADFSRTLICRTIFGNVDLSSVKGLETAWYLGRSFVDMHTIHRSRGQLPLPFLRGVGFPERALAYTQEQGESPVPSCFLVYHSHDRDFVAQLSASLQVWGVRCWPVVDDSPPERIFSHVQSHSNSWMVDQMVQAPDKMVFIVSQAVIQRLRRAPGAMQLDHVLIEEQKKRGQLVLPVYIDQDAWENRQMLLHQLQTVFRIRLRMKGDQEKERERLSFDFSHWRDQETYQATFQALIDAILS